MTEEKQKVWEELQTMAQNVESASLDSKIILFLAVLSKQNDDTERYISEMEHNFETKLSDIQNSINDLGFRLGALDSMVTKIKSVPVKKNKKAIKKKVVKKKKSKVFKHRK